MSEPAGLATKRLTVKQIIQETPDTKSFVLESTDGTIEYKSGQFLTFVFTGNNGQEVRRSYSISSSFELNEPLTITVKRIVNGEYSRLLNDRFQPGDVLKTIGASGFFVLPERPEDYKKFVFMAAGSGITPAFALIKTLLTLHAAVEILLIYSNTSQAKVIFHKKLKHLQNQFGNSFYLQFLFSKSADAFMSRLTPESFEMFMRLHAVSFGPESIFYVCGPADYMRMVTYKLATLGVQASRIRKEIFHIQHPKIKPEPPDTSAHTVTIMRGSNVRQLTVQYPLTILQAARLLDIHIPYSCETGQCGTCVARCLQGTVWMANNEVLLDHEINNGIILTCTGYPVYGDITISV